MVSDKSKNAERDLSFSCFLLVICSLAFLSANAALSAER